MAASETKHIRIETCKIVRTCEISVELTKRTLEQRHPRCSLLIVNFCKLYPIALVFLASKMVFSFLLVLSLTLNKSEGASY